MIRQRISLYIYIHILLLLSHLLTTSLSHFSNLVAVSSMMVNGDPEVSFLTDSHVMSDMNNDSMGDIYPEHLVDGDLVALTGSVFDTDLGGQTISMTNPMRRNGK